MEYAGGRKPNWVVDTFDSIQLDPIFSFFGLFLSPTERDSI